MTTELLLTLALIAVANSPDQEPVRLLCNGTYSHWGAGIIDAPVTDFYVEIRGTRVGDQIIIRGVGFHGDYIVSLAAEHGTGFHHPLRREFEGFISRYSGELSLSEKIPGTETPDGGYSLRQTIDAQCSRAVPLY